MDLTVGSDPSVRQIDSPVVPMTYSFGLNAIDTDLIANSVSLYSAEHVASSAVSPEKRAWHATDAARTNACGTSA